MVAVSGGDVVFVNAFHCYSVKAVEQLGPQCTNNHSEWVSNRAEQSKFEKDITQARYPYMNKCCMLRKKIKPPKNGGLNYFGNFFIAKKT